ncbi:beta-N-acetylhexosaminidase [Pedobacter glucosidilyticus]|uniref:beta-N-acetylhexosaminidase n=1 Tax=Pedobacter glucosidilyticus TaxID=1122941 RepID=UPI0026EC36D8|nr:beta-N-acetylhexosaminidase [Pedobacter glucosidilyticus]
MYQPVKLLFVIFFISFNLASQAQDHDLAIIPKPFSYEKVAASFLVHQATAIQTDEKSNAQAAYYFQNEVLKATGLSLGIKKSATHHVISFKLVPLKSKESHLYQIKMTAQKVEVIAATEEGLFRGATTLLHVLKQSKNVNGAYALSCWNMTDKAFFEWRGLMLDESRHFFGKEKVKQILDWMAFYKLNKFHWHLTDQPGWRIEIKKYPRLTTVGGVGNYSNPNAKAQYYSQEDIKEIIAYAANRFIEVIPEIDMPGHATAANLAYPQFSGGGSPKYPEFTFNPGKETTYQYLTDILKEVNVLFPSQKLHIGADEVHFGNQHWNVDADVQKLMKEKNFTSLKEVEHHFLYRMGDSILKMDNEILAWDEVVDSKLPTAQTTIFWWRHDKPEILKQALAKGFKTVLCPRLPLYFDFVQDEKHQIGRKWDGKFVTIEQVYQFPSQDILGLDGAAKLVQGIQANIWTESISTENHLDYMLFPRITALAESAWVKPDAKDFTLFKQRLNLHLKYFAEDSLYYFHPFSPEKFQEFQGPVQRKKQSTSTDDLTKQEKGL